jgi:hypothetical protein
MNKERFPSTYIYEIMLVMENVSHEY